MAFALTLPPAGAAAVSVGATDCIVDLRAPAGSFECALAITGGLLRTDGAPVVTVDISGATAARFRYDSSDALVAADVGGDITSYTYDEAGRLAARVDSDGRATRYTYDSLGRLTSAGDWAFLYSDAGLIGANDGTTLVQYTYDADGHMSGVSQNGAAERLAYDSSGRIVAAEGSSGAITYQYDDDELVRRVNGGTTTTEFSYDQHGRLVESSIARGGTTRFKYDNSDSLVRVADESGTRRFSYDRTGRLTAIIEPDGSATSFGYDPQGRLSLILPAINDEVVVSFEEGDPDRPIIIDTVYTRDTAPLYSLTLAGSLRTCDRCP
jgi:YD repeat-containing protein